MVNTIKFSQFPQAARTDSSTEFVGLATGANIRLEKQLNWTTATRPNPPYNGLMGFNTDLQSYEFWDAVAGVWTQFEDSGDIAALIARLAAHTLGDGASMIGLLNQGGVLNKTAQDFNDASFIAQTDNGTLPNGQFLASLTTGALINTTGTGVLSISAPLTSIHSLVTVADEMIYTTAPNTYATTGLTAFARSLLNDPDAATARTTLGIGSIVNTIYISPTGNDITGLGTIFSPYATYERARTEAILTATALNQFNIIAQGIFNIVGDLTLSPFVNINGYDDDGSQFILTGEVNLDPNFDLVASPTCHVSNVSINAGGDINLTFNAFQNAVIHLDNCDFSGTANLNATGAGLNISPELVLVENCVSVGGSPVYTFTNVLGALANSTAGNGIISINNSAITNNTCILINLYGPTAGINFITTNVGTQTVIISAIFNYGSTVTIDGTNNNVLIDSSSYMVTPTYLNGATAANITLISMSDGIEANTNFTPGNYVPVAGVNFKANSITGNLQGIDNALAGIVSDPIYAATTADLAGYVYNNGAGGVGATLTAPGVGAFTTDGESPPLNARILVSFQASALENGIYDLTTIGDGITNAILTRSTDYDQTAEIQAGDRFIVLNGTLYGGFEFVQVEPAPIVIGVDDINFQVINSGFLLIANNLSELTPTAGTARTNILAAVSGANNDITSMSALTGLLQAPTGIADAGSALVLGFDYIVGSISNVEVFNNNSLTAGPGFRVLSTNASSPLQLQPKNADVWLIDDTATIASGIRFYNAAGTQYTALRAETAQATTVDFTLPAVDGAAGASMITDGAGNLSFGTPAATGNKNLIQGGNFDTNPWQRGVSFVAVPHNTYTADRFGWFQLVTPGQVSIFKTADAPTFAEAGIFTQNCLHVDVTTADAGVDAGDFACVQTVIEGYDFAQIAQQPFTLSFWHKHTKTGTYCVAFRNRDNNRSYVAEYTQAVSDTWEFASVTASGSPTAGGWGYTNDIGISVVFTLLSGTNFQTTADAWNIGNFIATANQVNALDNTANNFKIQLVQLEVGSIATSFEIRTFGEELDLCLRYFEKSYNQGVYAGTATAGGAQIGNSNSVATGGANTFTVNYKTPKRAAATVLIYSFTLGTVGNVTQDNGTDVVAGTLVNGEKNVSVAWTNGVGRYQGAFHFTASAEFT